MKPFILSCTIFLLTGCARAEQSTLPPAPDKPEPAMPANLRAAYKDWAPVPIRSHQELAAGIWGGEGHQHARGIARPASDPHRVYLAIDVAGTWRSEDGGRSWIKNLDAGLLTQSMQTIAADNDNPDVVFTIAASPAGWHQYVGQYSGIYRSSDRGQNWTRVLNVPVTYEHQRFQRIYRQTIVRGIEKNTWFAAIDKGDIYRSTDGGQTWKSWWKNPGGQARKAWYALAVIGEQGREKVFAGSMDGLHLHQDKNGDGACSDDETAALPVPQKYEVPSDGRVVYGGGVTGVLVHPARPDDIVAVRRWDQSYRTVNGGLKAEDWKLVPVFKENEQPDDYEVNAPGGKPAGFGVNGFQNPYHPENRWMVSQTQLYGAAYEGAHMKWVRWPIKGYRSDPQLLDPIVNGLRNDHTLMAFHPQNPNDIVGFSQSTPWRLQNDVWVQSPTGFTGFAWTQQSSGARWIAPGEFGPDTPAGAVFFLNDVGPVVSFNALKSFTMTGGEMIRVRGEGKPGTAWSTSTTGDVDPHNRNHLLALWGQVGAGGFSLTRSLDGGQSWKVHPPVARGGDKLFNKVNFRHAGFARFLHRDGAKYFAAAFHLMTENADAAAPDWKRIRFEDTLPGGKPLTKLPPAAEIAAAPETDRRHVVADAHFPKTGAPTLWGYNTAGMQHLVRGEYLPQSGRPYAWSLVYNDLKYSAKGAADGKPAVAADPHHADRFYFAVFHDAKNNDDDEKLAARERFADNEVWLCRLRSGDGKSTANFNSPTVDKIRLGGGGQSLIPMPDNFNAVRAVAADPKRDGVVYVGLLTAGVANVFRVDFNAPAGKQLYDISGDLPRQGQSALSVRPDTDELYAGTHYGTFKRKLNFEGD